MTMEEVIAPKLPGRPMEIQEEVCDAEVMHVVNLKKQKVVINSNEELDRERPMSWEGELSDDDDDDDSIVGQPPKIGKIPDTNGTICPRPVPPIPTGNPGSPMCIAEREDNFHQMPKSVHQQPSVNGTLTQCLMNGSCTPSTHTQQVISTTCPTSNRNAAVTYAGGQGAAYTNDRLSIGHSSPYESPLCGHHSPAQNRHMVGYTGPYSQSPSPVLTRPTSSSSSRSSYSPAQSPLLGRYVSTLYSHNPSPVLSRHTTGNSSDGSVYSPLSSPSQGRHGAAESVICSPSQSPSQGRRNDNDGPVRYSPDRSPAHAFMNSSCRTVYNAPSSPNHVHWTVPDQSSTGLNNENNLGVHNQIDNSGFESKAVHISPLLPRSAQDARSTASSASVASSASDESNASDFASPTQRLSADNSSEEGKGIILHDASHSPLGMSAGQGISRQQLLSGPCPICGDRISGFHYGIFSCESCKGFFKRTVQNKKNYVCLRGANCHIAINTRKKCPACRFDKCLKTGMKLEAIREDRTRGGRSTYQCSYTLPNQPVGDSRMSSSDCSPSPVSSESTRTSSGQSLTRPSTADSSRHSPEDLKQPIVPALIQSILAVEHLWYSTDKEGSRLSEHLADKMTDGDPDFLGNLCNIADNRLFKIVKWCKSLPLFREIQTDDQIALLINSWCELLLLSCCYRSMTTPNEIRVSHGKYLNLSEARMIGLGPVIERMLNMTEHMRHLQVDQYEYVCLKVIILLTSDASGLKEPDKVRNCQKQVLEALQTYTRMHYPLLPSKFGELLLRIPDLERACQVGKESLASKQRIGEVPSFNLLMELLRGDH